MGQFGWKLDLGKCVGCHSCAISCKAENNTYPQTSPLEMTPAGKVKSVNYRFVYYFEEGTFPAVKMTFLTTACNHCKEPACLKSCPVGAISKRPADDPTAPGVVLIDQNKCIGCKYCIWACPYGAPQFNSRTNKVEKCTGCIHRLEQGLLPACVTTCAGRALTHTLDFQDGDSGKNKPSNFSDEKFTKPSIQFGNYEF
ncbi:MAG: 4Fe-4S dicluster domain-containing protein [Nitrospirae bacterium]|nr:4Fe-4S dicluster domain-containing protein [Nitrospirota bacterium]